MYESVLDNATQKTIEILALQDFFKSFYLAGGTACALHLGHRYSIDLDFFIDFEFRSRFLQSMMATLFEKAVHRMISAFEERAHQIYG